MNNNFERSLPDNYVVVKHVDAKNDTKQILVYALLSFVPLIIILPILCVVAKYVSGYDFLKNSEADYGFIAIFVTCIVYLVYIVLHELTHGITYKCFTGEKLTYGFTLTVAFCGVPNIYVRKKASITALIMPFAVFSIIFIGLTIGLWFVSPLYGVLAGSMFSLHLGGCVGDLHWTLLYLTKYRYCNTLMRDTGPEQWLYVSETEAKEYGIVAIDNQN